MALCWRPALLAKLSAASLYSMIVVCGVMSDHRRLQDSDSDDDGRSVTLELREYF